MEFRVCCYNVLCQLTTLKTSYLYGHLRYIFRSFFAVLRCLLNAWTTASLRSLPVLQLSSNSGEMIVHSDGNTAGRCWKRSWYDWMRTYMVCRRFSSTTTTHAFARRCREVIFIIFIDLWFSIVFNDFYFLFYFCCWNCAFAFLDVFDDYYMFFLEKYVFSKSCSFVRDSLRRIKELIELTHRHWIIKHPCNSPSCCMSLNSKIRGGSHKVIS